jgi:hypothetical protein
MKALAEIAAIEPKRRQVGLWAFLLVAIVLFTFGVGTVVEAAFTADWRIGAFGLAVSGIAVGLFLLARSSPDGRLSSCACALTMLGSMFFIVFDSRGFPWIPFFVWLCVAVVAVIGSAANLVRERRIQFAAELVLEFVFVFPFAGFVRSLVVGAV